MTEVPQGAIEATERERVQASELSWALRAVVVANGGVDRELARRLDLRPLDYAALDHVMTASPAIGPAELSTRLGISTGSGTELVDRLERAGHLRRTPHPQDRRRVSLQPTQSAVAAILATLAPIFSGLDALAEDFTAEEQETIRRYLRAVQRCLDDYSTPSDDALR